MLVFIMDVFDCRVSNFTRLLMSLEVSVNLLEVGDGEVKVAAPLNVHNAFCRYAFMISCYILMRNNLY